MIDTLGTIVKWAILLPVLLLVLLLAIANDQSVTVRLNPFDAEDTALTFQLALYQIGFLLFLAGALVGSLVTWTGQSRHRQQARRRQAEARFWHDRAERQEARQGSPQGTSAVAYLPRPERG